jgi:hypothetical protein
MDKRVTLKFWQVYPALTDGVAFDVSLDAAFSLTGQKLVRKIEDTSYQLEPRSNVGDDIIFGDIVRLQSDALPSKLKAGEKAKQLKLGNGEYLGHHTAFVYDREKRLLGFEVKPAAAGMIKVMELVASLVSHQQCQALPVLTESDISRLVGTKNGTISFKVADPASLNTLDPELGTVRENMAFLRDMVDGAYITITVGVGPRKDGLDVSKSKRLISWLLGEREAERGKVRDVRVSQPHESEPILDFVKAQFRSSETLDLTGNPDTDWPKREAFLRSSLAKAKVHVSD